MKTIRQKILVTVIAIMTIALVSVGGAACWLNYTSTLASLEQTMSETVRVAVNQVDKEINGYRMLIQEMAREAGLGLISEEQHEAIAEKYGFEEFMVTDKDGKSPEERTFPLRNISSPVRVRER